MDLGIKGKIALVTAASKGLGKAVATQLASEGANVIICSRNLESLQKTKFEIAEKTNAEVNTITRGNVFPTELMQVVESVQDEFDKFAAINCL